MAQPYLGEIRIFGGNFAPLDWALCQGQLMSISQNTALFTLLGTTYGGDGQTTFALPDLRSRVPIHVGTASSGTTYTPGQAGGVEGVTLSSAEMPGHTHGAQALSAAGNATSPANAVLAAGQAVSLYTAQTPATAMAPGAVQGAGGSQPHTNIQPYLAVNFIIALAGVFPSQN